ncbi:hypothetical protein Runsl_4349 [Runella slithyformis DSM 19594]|uniref:Uncharacterized protein n=1 Tax=Runella slithyformis (strain ATCC 29530 / DSM 19594 / LMG 11500 / NCIMB 11436 / LSU 4) TaxID=761193 RepID=A0A7U4E7H3_RUNSL|nr:hypothetical protein Runsl_4349 [Runella slithyformis DSM 19594]
MKLKEETWQSLSNTGEPVTRVYQKRNRITSFTHHLSLLLAPKAFGILNLNIRTFKTPPSPSPNRYVYSYDKNKINKQWVTLVLP